MAKKEKKAKPIEKQRAGYKRRGIFYLVMIVLLIVGTVLVNVDSVEQAINRVVYPSSRVLTVDGEKVEIFSEISKDEGVDVSAFYYLDKEGEKIYVSPYAKLTKITMVKTSFDSSAKMRLMLIKRGVALLMAIFIILLVIYLLRFSYYLSNTDAELKDRIGSKMAGIRMKFDKPRKKKEK